ncbi:hypothetical protein [Ralstonia solanacearum]|uniref:hypothetical protein n=1 Tax=Ralstonia solanacearum TaxID=305 RepID=UPI0001D96A98|nr:hypothetical protein [Ralstonia solanacearum]CBJ34820.1 hypothethical protein [Ralstonia solanacearum PSI07]
MSGNAEHEITPDVVQAGRENPNGWVYKIEGTYGPTEYVPPEAIVGAWKVDAHGNLTGEFMPNPKCQPGFSKANK